MQEKLGQTLKQVAEEATTSVQNAEASVQSIKSQCDEAERRAAELQPELEEKISMMNISLEKAQKEEKKSDCQKSFESGRFWQQFPSESFPVCCRLSFQFLPDAYQ